MSLNKRLLENISKAFRYGELRASRGSDPRYVPDPRGVEQDLLEAIKQAFLDEGWADKHDTIVKTYKAVRLKNTPLSSVIDEELFMKLPDYMTGAEWLARFEKELHAQEDRGGHYYENGAAIKAARRAAGVEE